MPENRLSVPKYDPLILLPVIVLTALGLIFVYSASTHWADFRHGDSLYYFKKHALFCTIGLVLMVCAKNISYKRYVKFIYPILLASFCLLFLLFVPGCGHKVGGACRWLRLWGGFYFQPSEFAKFSLTIYMAYSVSKKGSNMKKFTRGLLPHLIVVGIFILFIISQPDFGTALIIGCWLLIILFVSGVKLRYLALVSLLGVLSFSLFILMADYRINRLKAFCNPWEDPQGIGYHIIHSFFAFASGGLLGEGIGQSKQKMLFLPEAHTDFVFSIIGEELGFIGVFAIACLFCLLIIRGLKIALAANDLFSAYLVLGIVCMIGLQATINMGVVLGILPTKGLTLPFISYGGSSLTFNFINVGILLNISSEIQS